MSIPRSRLLATCVATLAVAAQSAPCRAAETLQPAPSIAAIVTAAAQRFAIPETWIYAVMRVESGGDARAVSSKGASGLMQIMPATWAYLRPRYGLGENIFDVRDNIVAGAAYLRELHDRYGAPGFLAAYNAGPQRYEAYLRTGRPLPAETVRYLARVLPAAGTVSLLPNAIERPDPFAWTRSGVFVGASGTPGFSKIPDTVEPASPAGDGNPVRSHARRSDIFVLLSSRLP